jgi:transcriptional repressor NrdR
VKCPACGKDDDRVVDSRSARDGMAIRRRRECGACNERFTTYEAVDRKEILVVKRDGRRVQYERAKVVGGVARACEKRPVSLEQMEAVADAVERELEATMQPEVPAQRIGELVMDRLREVDEVAYVRFASVYRSFKDVDEFMTELRGLLGGEEGPRGGTGR